MTNQPRKLSEVVETSMARQGENDGKWFLMEHQLYESRFALQVARLQMELVGDAPENEQERELAGDVLEILTPVYTQILGANASIKSLLASTEVAERVGSHMERKGGD